jgi:hypothetical protein
VAQQASVVVHVQSDVEVSRARGMDEKENNVPFSFNAWVAGSGFIVGAIGVTGEM